MMKGQLDALSWQERTPNLMGLTFIPFPFAFSKRQADYSVFKTPSLWVLMLDAVPVAPGICVPPIWGLGGIVG